MRNISASIYVNGNYSLIQYFTDSLKRKVTIFGNTHAQVLTWLFYSQFYDQEPKLRKGVESNDILSLDTLWRCLWLGSIQLEIQK